ncbi:MAG: hypothetical protein QNK11_05215 [Legionella sp.]|nr:hypothetical protein [Legionella sp.]
MSLSNKQKIEHIHNILFTQMKNQPHVIQDELKEAVTTYCKAKQKGKRHNVGRDIGIAKELSQQVVKDGDFQALLDFVQGKDRQKRSVFLKGPSQGKNSLMDVMLTNLRSQLEAYGLADVKATPREIFEPVLIKYLHNQAEKMSALKEGVSSIKKGADNTGEPSSSDEFSM